jgi:CheY-like chemotaxis protein
MFSTCVLVVDDDLHTAKQFAELVKKLTNLDAIATDSPDEAIDIIRCNDVGVALLDQKMPEKDGTELFKELETINPSLKAIMLTGEAETSEVGKAIALGYSDYLEKSRIEELAAKVLHYYTDYKISTSDRRVVATSKLIARSPRQYIVFGSRLEYRLVRLIVLDDEYIPDSAWETVMHLNAGQHETYEESFGYHKEVVIEDQAKKSLAANASFSVPFVQESMAKLEQIISTELSSKVTERVVAVRKRQCTSSLPAEPVNPMEVYVKSRHLQRARVYTRVVATVSVTCDRCMTQSSTMITVLWETNKYATRHDDYLSDGTRRTIDTGIIL